MPIYFSRQWWSGMDRDASPGELLDPQPDWAKPQYRPGWIVKYRTSGGKRHTGRIRFVLRENGGRIDFYRVIRTKNNDPEITFDSSIIERVIEETDGK